MRSGRLDPAPAIKRKGRNTEIARVEKARLAIPASIPDIDGQLVDRIHCGDAVETMRKLPDDLASLVLFSPPYFGVPIEYDPPLPKQTYAEYLTYQRDVLVESFRTVRPGADSES